MRISIDGHPVGFDDSGGEGPPLVLVHGFGCDRSAWDAVMPLLRGVRVIRPDLRGCGETPRGEGPALMEMLASDIAALLDALHVERATIVGHSMGGYVAFAFFRMYAERVAALGFVASHPLSDTPDGAERREALAARTERDGTMDGVLAAYLPLYFAPRVYERRPELVEEARAMIARQDARGAAQLLRGMKERVDCEDLYADVCVPTLVLAGRDDAAVPVASSRRVADGIDGATLTILEDVGHMTMLEAPERTAQALLSLVAAAVR